MTEPYTTIGILLGFAGMLYGDQANADAAEQAFNSTDGTPRVSRHRRLKNKLRVAAG